MSRKTIDGLLWYNITPYTRWTNRRVTTPSDAVTIALPHPRQLNSISLGIFNDTARDGVITCQAAIRVSTRDGTVIAERNPLIGCVPNSLTTIPFPSTSANT
ncbi:hypothetical protein B0A49_05601 [Cryomyces minteri]|nr:hypothetical protein B0A49_06694 [Cryomyces minteri]TKA71488.1 hypothetical protein B0A49_05601 [Cryomyces minteri]